MHHLQRYDGDDAQVKNAKARRVSAQKLRKKTKTHYAYVYTKSWA